MKRSLLLTSKLCLLATCLTLSSANDLTAQAKAATEQLNAETQKQEGYYGQTPEKPPQKSPVRLRAELRAKQRASRLAAMRWYGFSASRPTATGIPFTSMYSPSWSRPGGRPYAWYTTQRPIVIVSPYYPAQQRPAYYR